MKQEKKKIGITLGDPSGVGPEVVAKALARPSIRRLAKFMIIGDKIASKKWPLGKMNRASAMVSLNYLREGVELLKSGEISALVTAPVCKEAICRIEPDFTGHTEFLAKAFGVKNVGMMFVAGQMRTILVTRHIPLNQVSSMVNTSLVFETIQLTHHALKNIFKIKNPIVAVCGLNPHAGEGGNLGCEEIEKIIPAIKKAKAKCMRIVGPLAADTLFLLETLARYDAIIAMYHDQGLIPVKTLAFKKVVNLTVGLPFIRTSPAHGTAFDIAGKNKADATSMIEAIKLAVNLS